MSPPPAAATAAAAAPSPASPESQSQPLVLYDAVWIRRNADLRTETYFEGVVEYIGSVDFADGNDWIGIRLTGASQGLGKNNGTVQGRFYFDAPPNCGLFVRQSSGVVQRRSLTKLEQVRLRRDLGIAVSPSSLATSAATATTMTATTTTPTNKSRSSTTTTIMTATTTPTKIPSHIPFAVPASATQTSQQQQQRQQPPQGTVAEGKITVS
jgi:CAP-Gly domain